MTTREDAGAGDRRCRVGRLGEGHAATLLESRGCVVLDRNWRSREGEIDLVVVDPQGGLRFVEVRTRTGTGFGTPAESVTPAKRARVRTVARAWLAEHRRGWPRIEFDVVGVDLSDASRPRLELFEGVF